MTTATGDTVLRLPQVFWGNIYGSEYGQVVVAATPGYEQIAANSFNAVGLGDFVRSPERWRRAEQFHGLGWIVLRSNVKSAPLFVVTSLIKTKRGDPRLPYLYHWLFLTLDDIVRLGGNWRSITRIFETDESAFLHRFPQPGKPFHLIEPVEIPVMTGSTIHYQRSLGIQLSHYFSGEQGHLLAQTLLSGVVDDHTPIYVQGLPESLNQREDFVAALSAVLPPAFRGLFNWSVRVVDPNLGRAGLVLIDDDQSVHPQNSFLLDWNSGKWNSGRTPSIHFAIQRLFGELEISYERLLEFHQNWRSLEERLVKMRPVLSEALELYMKWIHVYDWKLQSPDDPDLVDAVLDLLSEDDGTFDLYAEWVTDAVRVAAFSDTYSNYTLGFLNVLSRYPRHRIEALDHLLRLVKDAYGGRVVLLLLNFVQAVRSGSWTENSEWITAAVWKSVSAYAGDPSRNYAHRDAVAVLERALSLPLDAEATIWYPLIRTAAQSINQSRDDDRVAAQLLFRLALRYLAPNQLAELLNASLDAWWRKLIPTVQRVGVDSIAIIKEAVREVTTLSDDEKIEAMLKLALAHQKIGAMAEFVDTELIEDCFRQSSEDDPSAILDTLRNLARLPKDTRSKTATALLGWISEHQDELQLDNRARSILVFWNISRAESENIQQAQHLVQQMIMSKLEPRRIAHMLNDAAALANRDSAFYILSDANKYFRQLTTDGVVRTAYLCGLFSVVDMRDWVSLKTDLRLLVETMNTSDRTDLDRLFQVDNLHRRLLEWFSRKPPQDMLDLSERMLRWWLKRFAELAADRSLDATIEWLRHAADAFGDNNPRRVQYLDELQDEFTQISPDFLTKLSGGLEKFPKLVSEKQLIDICLEIQHLLPLDQLMNNVEGAISLINKILRQEQILPEDMGYYKYAANVFWDLAEMQLSVAEQNRLARALKLLDDLFEDLGKRAQQQKRLFTGARKYNPLPLLQYMADAVDLNNPKPKKSKKKG
ncbi:MAG: hypothetical protein IPO91_28890 [Chloroflexi bacterium]|nr:hypothetical protein [Chloroflexota bacterium]